MMYDDNGTVRYDDGTRRYTTVTLRYDDDDSTVLRMINRLVLNGTMTLR